MLTIGMSKLFYTKYIIKYYKLLQKLGGYNLILCGNFFYNNSLIFSCKIGGIKKIFYVHYIHFKNQFFKKS